MHIMLDFYPVQICLWFESQNEQKNQVRLNIAVAKFKSLHIWNIYISLNMGEERETFLLVIENKPFLETKYVKVAPANEGYFAILWEVCLELKKKKESPNSGLLYYIG